MKRIPKIAKRKLKAFSLVELLIVLVIIGLLVSLALPSFQSMVGKAHSTEAKLQLKHLYTLQKGFFMEKSKYAQTAQEAGFEQQKLVTEDGNAKYAVEVVQADATGFLARATAVVDFDSDGTFNVWEIDQEQNIREVVQD